MSGRLLVPVYLVIDESTPMDAYRSALVHGLTGLIDTLRTDPRFPAGIQLSILGFADDVHVRLPLADIRGITSAPDLIMRGAANYGAVFGDLLTRIPADVQRLKTAGNRVFRPIVFFLTGGRPTEADAWRDLRRRLTDQATIPAAPIMLAYGLDGAPADVIRQVATEPGYAFVAPRGLDTGAAVASLVRALADTMAAIVTTGDDVPATPPPGVGSPGRIGPIDLTAARQVTERSRLVLAESASIISMGVALIIVIGSYKIGYLLTIMLPLLVALFGIGIAIRVYRARLLGSAVLVTRDSLPSLHADLEAVRDRLDYHAPADVYVAATVEGKASVTRFLGTRVILLEGGFANDLVTDGNSAMRRFVLASMLGKLKTRSERLEWAQRLMELTDVVKFSKPFLLPYYRATQYTGDRIGLEVTSDLGAALEVIDRMLAGKDTARTIGVRGLVAQAEIVQTRRLTRLAQLTGEQPHLINRYVSLLAYARTTVPDQFRDFRDALAPDTQARLDHLMQPFATENPTAASVANAGPLIVAISGALVLAGVIAVSLMHPTHLRPSTTNPLHKPMPSYVIPTYGPTPGYGLPSR